MNKFEEFHVGVMHESGQSTPRRVIVYEPVPTYVWLPLLLVALCAALTFMAWRRTDGGG